MRRKKIMVMVLVLLVLSLTVTPIGTAQFKVEASEACQKMDFVTGKITDNDVNLRTGPGKTFKSICKLKKDQKVTVIGKLGSWYAVYIGSSGNVGAISAYYVKLDKSKAAVSSSTTSTQSKSAAKADKTTAKTKTVSGEKAKPISTDEQAILNLVNKERQKKGLKALVFDAELAKVARLKAVDMRDNSYFSHTSKFYGTPFDMMKKYNIKFSTAGENIAGNQSAEKAVKAWAAESSNNLFNKKFTNTGIGIVDSPTYGKLFVEMFIKK